jgi:type IV secretion system protein VirB6
MGFFAEFSQWLNTLLAAYIDSNTARIAGLLEPALVSLGALYVALWGYLQLSGKIEEPFIEGVKRLVTLALILTVCLRLWLYHEIIVETFFSSPGELAAQIVGSYDAVGTVDKILFDGGDAAALLFAKAGIFDGDFSFYLAGLAVYVVVGITAIYTMFLLSLSKIALSILLALGPLFIGMLLFESTKRFTGAWLAQLANYAFITLLTVMTSALMLHVISTAAQQAASAGGGIEISHAVKVCIAAGLTFLILKQIPSIAAGLASGIALSSMDAVSRLTDWGIGRARAVKRNARELAGGLTDSTSMRSDSLARKVGFHTRQRLSGLVRRENAMQRAG